MDVFEMCVCVWGMIDAIVGDGTGPLQWSEYVLIGFVWHFFFTSSRVCQENIRLFPSSTLPSQPACLVHKSLFGSFIVPRALVCISCLVKPCFPRNVLCVAFFWTACGFGS